MKLLKRLSASILIVSALLLLIGRNASEQNLGRPSQSLTQQGNNAADEHQTYSGQWTGTWMTNTAHGDSSTKESGEDSNQNPSPLWKIWEWITSISAQGFFNFIIAVATGFIACFNWQLVGVTDEMKTAAKAAADAAEAALHINRPFLLVTEVKSISLTRDGRGDEILYIYEFEVCLRNFGVGPADIVDYIAGAAVRNVSIPVQPVVEPQVCYAPTGRRLSESLVAPGETAKGRIKVRATLNRAHCDAVRNGEGRIGIDGIIRYRGASKQMYWTRFFWWCFLDAADSPINIQWAIRIDLNDHN